MIRKVELYKDVKDYLVDSVHAEVRDFSSEDHKQSRGYEFLSIITVCPCCGQEQCLEFEWLGSWSLDLFGRDYADSTDKGQWMYLNYVFNCVDDYFKNHFVCLSCNKDLSFKPGYLYAIDPKYFLRYKISSSKEFTDNVHLPYGYKHKEAFIHDNFCDTVYFDGYENDSLFEKYAEKDGDSLYKNSLSRRFLDEIGDLSPIERILELMKRYRQFDDIYEDDVKSLVQTETDRLDDSVEAEPISKELSTEQIKSVLKEVIGFETTIISLSGRLKRLFLIKNQENGKFLDINTNREKNEIQELEKRIKDLEEERISKNNSQLNVEAIEGNLMEKKLRVSYPTEPIKPTVPAYETPGLFNKKKVEAANAEKKLKYDAELASYNAAVSEYNRLLSEAQIREKELKEEIHQEALVLAQEERNKELSQLETQIADCQSKIETDKNNIIIKEKEIQIAKESLSELPWNKEFDQAVDLLKKTLESKIIYEKSEIIFGKYQNLVAYSQFYEYFQAGRCTSLTGPDGAYNLYENELRQNIIIGKLDDISNSLEEIKQNQFMIYSELKSINSNISKLDDSMNKILGKVTEIGTNVEAIRNSTEIMEENSKIAAYYSKKNAELTNAMGYLVALK